MRFESEDIPSFRPDIQETAIHFGWGEKFAPRLGFAYNLFGDDRVKISGSYGRYYDWTKYELARGTFGGDIWTTRYRSLDDPDISKLSRANLTGRNLWDSQADSYKDHRIPSFGSDVVDPEHEADGAGLLQPRVRVPGPLQHRRRRQLRAHGPAAHD